MELLGTFFDFILHLDEHLQLIVQNYGAWIYPILFLIVFCETGLVLTPFLPGDALLFVAGTLAATGAMYVHGLFALLVLAAFTGDNANYWIGRFSGPRIFRNVGSRWFNPEYLGRSQQFYRRHGGKTVIFARFAPIIRTFIPFVAGIGRMDYARFVFYSFTGSVLWIGCFVFGGYYFGSIPAIKQNLMLFVLGIAVLSLLPAVVEFTRQKKTRTLA